MKEKMEETWWVEALGEDSDQSSVGVRQVSGRVELSRAGALPSAVRAVDFILCTVSAIRG